MSLNKIKILICIIASCCFFTCQGQLLAFPDAKGFGKFSTGGRGGDVILVTNLNDNGAGSFRSACEASGSRTVIFKIGGTISLNSTIEITNPNITIAGQTAPGGGICLKMNNTVTTGNLQATLAILADDVIIRGLRFRAGSSNSQLNLQINDCLDIWDGENIIIDHCSFTWGEDENIAIWSDQPNEHPKRITIQKSIIGQALQKVEGGEITRGYGMLIGGSTGATDVSIIDNLFIHNAQRNPLLKSEQTSIFELYNNVIYNYGFFGTDISEKVEVNLISNLYLAGNNTSTNRYEVLINKQASLFVEGNIGLHRSDNMLPEWDIVGFNGVIPPDEYSESLAPLTFQSTTPFLPIPNEVIPTDEVFDNLISSMDIGANFKLNESGNGEFINNMDDVDLTLISDLINNTGEFIFNTDIENTIQYPILESGVSPIDSDEDGMPDLWEEVCGLNINDPTDRNEIASNQYTNLENYLNGVSCTTTSTKEIFDSRFTVFPNPTNGILYLQKRTPQMETIFFFNILGEKIFEQKIGIGISTLDISMLKSGMYFLYSKNNHQKVKVILN